MDGFSGMKVRTGYKLKIWSDDGENRGEKKSAISKHLTIIHTKEWYNTVSLNERLRMNTVQANEEDMKTERHLQHSIVIFTTMMTGASEV